MFGMFKNQAPAIELNPRNALVVSLVYCMSSDGEMDSEEVAHLVSVLGPNATRQGLDACVKYARATPVEQFLGEVAPRLSAPQKLCVLLNMIDSVMADGEAEAQEQALFGKFSQAFGVSEAELEPHFRTLVAKNDRAVLDR
jgi:uncharacterized tellurite resistance protein B-like protein